MSNIRRIPCWYPFVLLLVSVFASAQTAWKEYSFLDDGFSIEAPAKPSFEKVNTTTALGPIEQHTYQIPLGVDTGFMISASPLKGDSVELRKLLAAAKNGAASNSKSTASKEKDVFLDGKLGIEFVLENETFHSRVRVFYIEGKLLTMMAIAPSAKAIPEETDRFFSSLRLLKKPS